jgi:hypothetical protein
MISCLLIFTSLIISIECQIINLPPLFPTTTTKDANVAETSLSPTTTTTTSPTTTNLEISTTTTTKTNLQSSTTIDSVIFIVFLI